MTIEIDEIVKARMREVLEEVKNNAHFLQKQEGWRDAANRFEDMTNLISVYDAVRQLKKVLFGRMDEHWEDVGAFSVFEYVFNGIA